MNCSRKSDANMNMGGELSKLWPTSWEWCGVASAIPAECKRPVHEKPKLTPVMDFIEAILESEPKGFAQAVAYGASDLVPFASGDARDSCLTEATLEID